MVARSFFQRIASIINKNKIKFGKYCFKILFVINIQKIKRDYSLMQIMV